MLDPQKTKENAMETIRYAVVGCGGIANNYHLPALTAIEDGQFVVACDIIEDRAKGTAEKFGAQDWTLDYQEAVSRDDVDLVCVFTKIDTHALISTAAMRAGKHVFQQKPFAATLREGQQMVDAAKAKGVQLITSFMHSFFDESLAAGEWVKSGKIGRLEFLRQRNATGNPRESAPSYGGAMMDIGAHGIALIRALTGEEIVRVVSKLEMEGAQSSGADVATDTPNLDLRLQGDEVNAWMLYQLSGGATVSHEVQWSQRGGTSRFQTEVYGTDGSVLVRVPRTDEDLAVAYLSGEPGAESRKFEWAKPELPGRPMGQAHHEWLLDTIRKGEPMIQGDYGMAVIRVCEAIRRSAAAGVWVEVQTD